MTKFTHLYIALLLFIGSINVVKSSTCTSSTLSSSTEIQLVYIDFKMPNGYVRHLALGFTPDNIATDGYDYGYDALNIDDYPYDLNWMIEDKRYVIQGVGAFDDSKKYPFGMFMSHGGDIEISLNMLENFTTPIDLFIYDSQLNTYTRINDSKYAANISKGDYLNRFYLAFKNDDTTNNIASNNKTLSTEDFISNEKDFRINYLSNTHELYVNTNDKFVIKNIHVYNSLGQKIFSMNQVNSKLVKVPYQTHQSKYGIVIVETDYGGILSKKIAVN